MRFSTSDHIFNIHDVQLIIIFISLTKIKDIVENLDELYMFSVFLRVNVYLATSLRTYVVDHTI